MVRTFLSSLAIVLAISIVVPLQASGQSSGSGKPAPDMLTNYTFSHCISDPYDQQTSGNGLTPPGNRRAYRGNCTVGNADVRHYFTLNMVMNTPKFSNSTLQTVIGSWQIAPILALKSGNFLSILSGTDRALTTAAGQTANQVSPDVYSPNKGKACANVAPCVEFLNKNAFEIPSLGTYGNMPNCSRRQCENCADELCRLPAQSSRTAPRLSRSLLG